MQLAPGWRPWVLTPALVGVALLAVTPWIGWGWIAGAVALLLAVGVASFFRDPDREIGAGLVAPADGRLQRLGDRAVTFLNLHDVHVVRAPLAGRIVDVTRTPGPRLPAFLDSADKNGGVSITLATDAGTVELDLIAGFVARRAVPFVREDETVEKGERLGMIRFGSRVDVDIPTSATSTVAVGQRVRAGETTIAELSEEASSR